MKALFWKTPFGCSCEDWNFCSNVTPRKGSLLVYPIENNRKRAHGCKGRVKYIVQREKSTHWRFDSKVVCLQPLLVGRIVPQQENTSNTEGDCHARRTDDNCSMCLDNDHNDVRDEDSHAGNHEQEEEHPQRWNLHGLQQGWKRKNAYSK